MHVAPEEKGEDEEESGFLLAQSKTVNLEALTCQRNLFSLDSLNLAKNSFVIFLYQSFKILPPFPHAFKLFHFIVFIMISDL